eukprot:COSAG03_NODE_1867_length_3407_cov_7.205077_4_plen_294_part_00
MSGVIDLTEEDDHAADTEEDEPAQTAAVAGGAAAQPVLTGVAFWQHGPCCGDRCRSCLWCATTTPCHQREPCLCEEAGEQGGRPEEELRRLQQAREEALVKKAIASSLAPAPPSESPADERAYNAQLAEAMRQSVEEARLRQSVEGALPQPRHHRLFRSNGVPKLAFLAPQPSHIFTLRLIASGALPQPLHHRLFRSNGVPKLAFLAPQPSHTGIVHTTLCGTTPGDERLETETRRRRPGMGGGVLGSMGIGITDQGCATADDSAAPVASPGRALRWSRRETLDREEASTSRV